MIAQQFPTEDRALAGGIFNSCTFLGLVVAPPLVAWLTIRLDWHKAFLLPSAFGLLWLLPWLSLFPRQASPAAPRPSVARLDKVAPASFARGDLKALLRRRQTWASIAIRALTGPMSQFYWFWLPEYLKRARHIDLATIGKVVWIPYFCGGLGNVLGGILSGFLLRRGTNLTFSRRLPFILGAGLAAVCNFLVTGISSLPAALAILSLATLGANVLEASYIGFVTDIFPQRTLGRVVALTGIADNCMGIILMLTTGIVLDRFSYFPVFMGASVLPILQIVLMVWLLGPIQKLALPEESVQPA